MSRLFRISPDYACFDIQLLGADIHRTSPCKLFFEAGQRSGLGALDFAWTSCLDYGDYGLGMFRSF